MNCQNILNSFALILSIINGVFLATYYFKDKPKLEVKPVYPKNYQWWFRLPNGKTEDGSTTRKYGFLTYISINNKGLRKTTLDKWNLKIKNKKFENKKLNPISIPEPESNIGDSNNKKVFSVIGQKGINYDSNVLIESGTNLSGMAYYVLEVWGDEVYSPKITNEKIKGKISIKDIFGNETCTDITYKKVSLDFIKELIPNIENIR